MTRVLLADDHKMFREALRALLEKNPGIEVVGEASDGREVLKLAGETKPEVVCMDVAMPGLNGIEATRRLVAALPGVKVIGLSAYSDQRFAVDMLDAGAAGYVTKAEAGEELLRAIRTVERQQTYLSPDVAGGVLQALRNPSAHAVSSTPRLAPREREVLQLLAEGLSTREIAARLHLASSTVEVHRRNIMRKLDLHSVAELTKYAVRHGITSA